MGEEIWKWWFSWHPVTHDGVRYWLTWMPRSNIGELAAPRYGAETIGPDAWSKLLYIATGFGLASVLWSIASVIDFVISRSHSTWGPWLLVPAALFLVVGMSAANTARQNGPHFDDHDDEGWPA